MNNITANETEFKSIARQYIHRNGIEDLLKWLDTTDFFRAPASTRYHGSEPGGLCAHSLAVYKYLKGFQEPGESDESIALIALFHDLCKINYYKESTRNVKNEAGQWIKVPCYEVDERSVPLGHGEKSLYILMKFVNVCDEEAIAIRWHMGFSAVEPIFEKPSMLKAMELSKLVIKLQTADSAASFWEHT